MSDVVVTRTEARGVCHQCGDPFTVRTSWQKYCSGRCTKRASMARLSDAWEQRRADPAWQAAERDRQRAWRAENSEKQKAKEARWKERNPEKARQKTQRWRAKNRVAVYEATKEERVQNPEKVAARKAVYHALKMGTLIRPDSCSSCGKSGKPQAHHPDYSRKLNVQWLCARCHKLVHLGG